jgi:hypothetical protein
VIPDASSGRAAVWALRALAVTRWRLRRRGLQRTTVPPPPALPAGATRGVEAILRRAPATCLERSLVRQRWLASHGRQVDVVIGVSVADGFGAHAWLDGDPDPLAERYHELKRIAAT